MNISRGGHKMEETIRKEENLIAPISSLPSFHVSFNHLVLKNLTLKFQHLINEQINWSSNKLFRVLSLNWALKDCWIVQRAGEFFYHGSEYVHHLKCHQ